MISPPPRSPHLVSRHDQSRTTEMFLPPLLFFGTDLPPLRPIAHQRVAFHDFICFAADVITVSFLIFAQPPLHLRHDEPAREQVDEEEDYSIAAICFLSHALHC